MGTWYCENCGYANDTSIDAYCCNCQRLRSNSAAIEVERLPSTCPIPSSPLNGCHTQTYDTVHLQCSTSLELKNMYLPSTSYASSEPQDPDAGKKRKFWYCCGCNDGPHGVDTVPACPSCGCWRCDNCQTVTMKK